MISKKLIVDIAPHLKEAEEIWVAVALMNDAGFNDIQEVIPVNTKQNFLVGIDLPTSVSVLKALQNKLSDQFKAGIYKYTETFHPKVYLIKKGTGFVGFVGSSNLTGGGMHKNTEMNLFIKDEQICIELIDWFENLFRQSYPLTDENINSYSEKFEIISAKQDEIRKTRKEIKLKRPEPTDDLLAGIDFSDRYFKKEHHFAFRKEIETDRSPKSNKERKEVWDKLRELHNQIFPKFKGYELTDLSHHKRTENIVSHYYHVDGFTSNKLNAMWLSYGKPAYEIEEYQKLFPTVDSNRKEKDGERDLQSFINHARLQIRIDSKNIEIWLLFGKDNRGSIFDRDYFKKSMNRKDYRDTFFNYFKYLPAPYWITVGNQERKTVSSFQDSDELYQFCKKDTPDSYFAIGREYQIADTEMSEGFLPQTVLTEFQRLFPIYTFMRDKRFKK